ncbi:MAG: serine hydrolase domain-containing protein [Cyanobacteria bacterium J06598_3]
MKHVSFILPVLTLATVSAGLMSFSLKPLMAYANRPVDRLIESSDRRTVDRSAGDAQSMKGVAAAATDNAVDAVVEQLMRDRNIPGISLAVVHDGKLIKTQGYGLLDRDRNIRTRPSSVFPIASMSKPFTAQGIMLLVQAGKVSLEAPISTYLPNTPDHWADITVRHLLTHTAGLSETVYESDINTLVTSDSFLQEAAKAPLDFQPGESWMYSNTGYYLAAIIIENVSEQPFDTFMERRIFGPLGLNHTDALRDSYVFNNRALGYAASGNGRAVEPIDFNFRLLPKFMPSLQGAGSITSTVLDVARWEIAMQKGQLLDLAAQGDMQQPVVMNSGRTFHYGLGWFLKQVQGHQVISHGGNIWGYSTSISRFPGDGLTVILLANKDNEQGDELAMKIAEQYVPGLVIDPAAPAIADPNPALTGQLLNYLNGDEQAISLTPEWQLSLSTPRGQGILRAGLSDMARIETLELLAQEEHANGMRYRYRGVTPQSHHLINAIITPDGMLAALGGTTEE